MRKQQYCIFTQNYYLCYCLSCVAYNEIIVHDYLYTNMHADKSNFLRKFKKQAEQSLQVFSKCLPMWSFLHFVVDRFFMTLFLDLQYGNNKVSTTDV